MAYQSGQSFGINRDWMKLLKKKAKDPVRKERLKELAEGVTKDDLQNREKVAELLHLGMEILGENPTLAQQEQLIQFVIDQKIDPRNKFQLIKLWSKFH